MSRPRLTKQLDEALRLGHGLILLSAPAGSSKTTLVREWLQTSGRPFVWLSLDQHDNEPVRFLRYLIAAAQQIQSDIGQGLPDLLELPQPPSAEMMIAELLEGIAAASKSFTLVLDDYHEISAQPVHDAITFLIAHMPTWMRLVIATRVDPPLPLARLRARGQMTELRMADLRFTQEEAAAFLNGIMSLGLPEEQIALLVAHTEGWIAGLQLAALSMRERVDKAAFISELTGGHRHLLDYLTEEVLGRQPESVQSFLLQTAVLSRLSGALCDALTGREDGQAMLERADAANLFVIPLDDERCWYRYHQLFGELLRAHLRATAPDRIPELHRRACRWYEANALFGDAVDHALAAQDFETAGRLTQTLARELWHGESHRLRAWLDALPQEMVRSRPSLCIARTWAMAQTDSVPGAEASLLEAERVLRAAEVKRTESEEELSRLRRDLHMTRIQLASLRADRSRVDELVLHAHELLTEDDGPWRTWLSWITAIAHFYSGESLAADQVLTDMGARVPDGRLRLALRDSERRMMGEVQAQLGRLRRAADIYRGILHAVEMRGRPASLWIGRVHILLAEILYEWDDLDETYRELLVGVELGRRWGDAVPVMRRGYRLLARVRQASGDESGAREAAQALLDLAPRLYWREEPVAVRAEQAQLWLAQNNLEAAERWERESGLSADDQPGYRTQTEYVTLARVRLAQGRPADALRLVAPLEREAETHGRQRDLIQLLALHALALGADGEFEAALSTLRRALALAEPERYIRTFVDLGEPMGALLRETSTPGRPATYVARLLAASAGASSRPPLAAGVTQPPTTGMHPLLEPLSARELEVLRLMADGLTNREIARRLFVSVGTVKTHIHHILGKLDTHNRRQTIAQARALKLLN